MKRYFILLAGCTYFFLSGCITEYEPKGLDEVSNILVVEGTITENESKIILSRSQNLTDETYESTKFVNDAIVTIERDDGVQIEADPPAFRRNNGEYIFQMGELLFDRKYRLKIEIVAYDCAEIDGPCPPTILEYGTDYMCPLRTPEIDSVFWSKKGMGDLVNIHVATHSTDSEVLFYRWQFREDWEIISDNESSSDYTYPYYCWNGGNSRNLLIGSAEKTVFGQLTNIIEEIVPYNRKLEVLYRIKVKQNAISKQAYEYFDNIKKNSQQTASIFAPVQSELTGNIKCITDPTIPVIGYVDISSTTHNELYISIYDRAYEYASRTWDCTTLTQDSLLSANGGIIPIAYVPFEVVYDINGRSILYYIQDLCVNCTNFGTTTKPDDWPNDHE